MNKRVDWALLTLEVEGRADLLQPCALDQAWPPKEKLRRSGKVAPEGSGAEKDYGKAAGRVTTRSQVVWGGLEVMAPSNGGKVTYWLLGPAEWRGVFGMHNRRMLMSKDGHPLHARKSALGLHRARDEVHV
ncbi:hypothetical protein NDU88_005406 [Pleurodeles waltl]|uniref:Uncharacterized protein n=1 Tax=Pleurodeles waltl TaxID=8319 RepID=A0AAV7MXT0_PLEWA|nr:hypothetical protein NDU88_005406 [Pleurodeles waltl]